jgi:hypothetical protein
VGLYSIVSQIRRVAPRIKIYHSDPLNDKSIKIFQQLKQIFKPYCIMYKELEGKKQQLPSTMFLQKQEKYQKSIQILCWGG